MVEVRMKKAIRMLGAAWSTAWIDAGQPQLPGGSPGDAFMQEESRYNEQLEQLTQKGKQLGRSHE